MVGQAPGQTQRLTVGRPGGGKVVLGPLDIAQEVQADQQLPQLSRCTAVAASKGNRLLGGGPGGRQVTYFELHFAQPLEARQEVVARPGRTDVVGQAAGDGQGGPVGIPSGTEVALGPRHVPDLEEHR